MSKSHEHDYCGCSHIVAYCKHCDVCYCTLCGREWGFRTYRTISPWYPNTTTPYWGTITYNSPTNTSGSVAINHNHNE
jgi:hypothetical protein